ncbi:methyl-accepting chemotaxis protein [Halorussus halobius]|uniref:methyl-accepting chemotaxis protein n=1 Tax=Halorussus halobius TaxID=1710537 RepID=UPI001092AFB7|nr:methyl-accepting chemotaxis protein [Halorussus halobius]
MSSRTFAIYERLLRGSMDRLGVSDSVERKILAAVAIQFGVAVLQAVIPFAVSGTLQYALVGIVFLGAVVAFFNTILIARNDVIEPLAAVRRTAETIGQGEISSATVPDVDQRDEIGDLVVAVDGMESYLSVVTAQSQALARQEFDADVLDEDVPGEFGDSLDRMATELREYTEELEEMTDELERRSANLTRLVEAFGDAAERARDGDLTATIDGDEFGDAQQFDDVVENYNELVKTLGRTVGDIAEFSEEVVAVSEEVLTGVGEVEEASQQVSTSVEEIADGAASQTSELADVASETTDLSATVEEIASSSDEVAKTAERATDRGRSGRDTMEETIAELRDLEAQSTAAAESVETLVEEIEYVDEIASFIDDVAEDTDMLALNASIEAARADGGGEGFAVVADEVKSLAEDTKSSAGEISDRIEGIQAQAEDAVSDIREMNEAVSAKRATAEEAMSDFEAIVGEIEEANAGIQEISDATDQQATSTEQVAAAVDEVAAVSEQTAEEADTVAAAAEEQTASVSEVRDSVGTLTDHAERLDEMLRTFEFDEDGESGEWQFASEDDPVGSSAQPLSAQ